MLKRINVTDRDSACGVKNNCQECPVARAIFRVARKMGWAAVNVGYSFFSLYSTKAMEAVPAEYSGDLNCATPEETLELPPWIEERIVLFDRDYGVEAFSFEIDIPEPPKVTA